MANAFFWYDVMTTDVAAARKFYTDVVGWETEDQGGLTTMSSSRRMGLAVPG